MIPLSTHLATLIAAIIRYQFNYENANGIFSFSFPITRSFKKGLPSYSLLQMSP